MVITGLTRNLSKSVELCNPQEVSGTYSNIAEFTAI